MHVPVEIQIWRLSVLALVGIGSALLFQLYRAFRSVFRPKRVGYHLLDALVALSTFAVIGAVVFVTNWGEIRLYVPLSLAAGFLVANALTGDAAYRGSRATFLQLKKSFRWVKRTVFDPPKRAIRQVTARIGRILFPPLPPQVPPDEGPRIPS